MIYDEKDIKSHIKTGNIIRKEDVVWDSFLQVPDCNLEEFDQSLFENEHLLTKAEGASLLSFSEQISHLFVDVYKGIESEYVKLR